MMHQWVVKFVGADFWKWEIGDAFACGDTTNGCYGKTEAMAGFSALKRSRNTLPKRSNYSWWCINRWWSLLGRNSENRKCFHFRSHNQWCYDKIEAMAGFSALKRSRNTLSKCSNCSWWCINRWWSLLGRNFENRKCFHLRSHNHWCYGKTEAMAGFSAMKRSELSLKEF